MLPALRATRGSVIHVASIAGFVEMGSGSGYAPSKGAIKLLTQSQSLAIELTKDGVRVKAIAPGMIQTAMTVTRRGTPEILQTFMLRTPLGRVRHAEELVGPMVFLASEMSSNVTGVILPVNGGFLAG